MKLNPKRQLLGGENSLRWLGRDSGKSLRIEPALQSKIHFVKDPGAKSLKCNLEKERSQVFLGAELMAVGWEGC